jgi:hypothetical protein
MILLGTVIFHFYMICCICMIKILGMHCFFVDVTAVMSLLVFLVFTRFFFHVQYLLVFFAVSSVNVFPVILLLSTYAGACS